MIMPRHRTIQIFIFVTEEMETKINLASSDNFSFFGGVFVFLFFYFFVCLLFVWVLFLFSCCFFVVGGGGGGVGGVCCCCFWGEGGSSSAYGISPPVFPGETNCVCPALATDTARESALKADRTIPLRCPNPAIHQQSYIPASVSGVKS